MSDFGGPVPQRIGDAERDRAAESLRDHLAEGRLDQAEFDDRLTRALTAKTASDLDPLFSDLPGPKPGSTLESITTFEAPPWQQGQPRAEVTPAAAAPTAMIPARWNAALTAVASVSWPLWIVTCFLIGWDYWWLVFIPICLSAWFGNDKKKRDELNSGEAGRA